MVLFHHRRQKEARVESQAELTRPSTGATLTAGIRPLRETSANGGSRLNQAEVVGASTVRCSVVVYRERGCEGLGFAYSLSDTRHSSPRPDQREEAGRLHMRGG